MMKSLIICSALILAIYAMPFDIFANFDPCNTCTFIVGRAEHHFKPNETENQLKKKLDKECRQLAHHQGQQAADHCLKIIDANIDTIYFDIKAGKRPHQICIDIGECAGPSPTGLPQTTAYFNNTVVYPTNGTYPPFNVTDVTYYPTNGTYAPSNVTDLPLRNSTDLPFTTPFIYNSTATYPFGNNTDIPVTPIGNFTV
uniref:Saposin B-type domain-containing protein n=1 Tax=Panagrolaimus sp. JU765 TaxID=591449 RepID=A0AC34R2R1_9BILA